MGTLTGTVVGSSRGRTMAKLHAGTRRSLLLLRLPLPVQLFCHRQAADWQLPPRRLQLQQVSQIISLVPICFVLLAHPSNRGYLLARAQLWHMF